MNCSMLNIFFFYNSFLFLFLALVLLIWIIQISRISIMYTNQQNYAAIFRLSAMAEKEKIGNDFDGPKQAINVWNI